MRLRKRQSEIEGGIKKVGLDVMTKGGKLCSLKLQKPEMSTRTGRTAISRISIAVKNYT